MKKTVEFLKSWKTSVAGTMALVLGLLVSFGVIEKDQADVVSSSSEGIAGHLSEILLYVMGLIGIFSKDGDKSTEDIKGKWDKASIIALEKEVFKEIFKLHDN